jgi:hypothetical protein
MSKESLHNDRSTIPPSSTNRSLLQGIKLLHGYHGRNVPYKKWVFFDKLEIQDGHHCIT